jgi:hypothetical protein
MLPRSSNHGLSLTPEYRAWAAMIQRCTNDKLPKYHRYGGRGIRVCEAWRKSFETFLRDMRRRPSTGHSLDRFPNADGNYEPGNCRWATAQEQQQNRTNNHMLTVRGETLPLTEWSRRRGINHSVLLRRIQRGWSPERACFEPTHSLGVHHG